MNETAYAKINLALHVRERRSDGYHDIETLFVFAEDGDRLSVGDRSDVTLGVEGPFAAALGQENLVLDAAQALRSRYRVNRGAALTLDKRLPVASGIGGGSADAAAALRLLVRWWDLDVAEGELLEIAASLGSDVPACLRSETAFGTGKGDELAAVEPSGLSGMPLLLVNPRIPVSTAEVFRAWDGVDRGPLEPGQPMKAACAGRNDLEAPAISRAPPIGNVLEVLRSMPGTLLSRMSGSGATCFALFQTESERDRAADQIRSQHPAWWSLASRLS